MVKVLIVDDSQTEVFKLRAMLEKNGYSVIVAETGGDGVRVAAEEQPDVVLMDVVMPGLNGFHATRQLTQGRETAHIPVIMVTMKNQETDRVWGARQGACAYLTKPVVEADLVRTIYDVIGS